jgi:hypothetical protein
MPKVDKRGRYVNEAEIYKGLTTAKSTARFAPLRLAVAPAEHCPGVPLLLGAIPLEITVVYGQTRTQASRPSQAEQWGPQFLIAWSAQEQAPRRSGRLIANRA